MNDLASAKASFKDQASIFKRKHNWLMCILYLGCFGSFLGFSAGFPLLTKTLFPGMPTAYAFLGPLIGALTRSGGGWLSDKVGGAKVTNIVFTGMILGVLGVLAFLPDASGNGGHFWGFFACFMLLFALAGLGNASTFMQIPVIFNTFHKKRADARRNRPRNRPERRHPRSRRRDRLHRRLRRLRRLPDPQKLRHIHRNDRQRQRRALLVHCALRRLRPDQLVVLPAQKRRSEMLTGRAA